MTMIADSRIIRRERLLADVTTRRATVRLPLLFRQRFHGHVGGYDIFHAIRQIVELLREPRYNSFHRDGSDTTIMCRRTHIVRSSLNASYRWRHVFLVGFSTPGRYRWWTALVPGCYSCQMSSATCCPRSAVRWRSRWSSGSPLHATSIFRTNWSNGDICKVCLYEFHHEYMYRDKCKIMYTDTDSLIYHI